MANESDPEQTIPRRRLRRYAIILCSLFIVVFGTGFWVVPTDDNFLPDEKRIVDIGNVGQEKKTQHDLVISDGGFRRKKPEARMEGCGRTAVMNHPRNGRHNCVNRTDPTVESKAYSEGYIYHPACFRRNNKRRFDVMV